MKKPKLDDIELNREQSDALIQRIEDNRLTSEDRQLLAKLIPVFLWMTVSLREAKISLGRLKEVLFGRGSFKKRKSPPPDDDDPGGGGAAASESESSAPLPESDPDQTQRRGHGRNGADAYSGAETVACRHDTLVVGARCPRCGRGRLYALDEAVTIRIDGHALLSAVRYEVERLRCSACTDVFTAPLPAEAGGQKYSPRAQVTLALSRYFLGVPFHRLEQLQAMLGVPVADATQWDQVEVRQASLDEGNSSAGGALKPCIEIRWVTNPTRQRLATSRKRVLRVPS